jgi:cytochrome c peroxidase
MYFIRGFALGTASAIALGTVAQASDDLMVRAQDMFAAIPSTIPAMADNPITP